MVDNYRCPKCNSKMYCISTASIPPITTYQCYSCGYTSKPIKEEYDCEVLPIELRSEEVKKVENPDDKGFRYNINLKIKVKLTEHGHAILCRDVMNSLSMFDLRFDRCSSYPEDEDGYITFQLWDFMRIFGSHFNLGCPLIIENNEIIFIDT